MNFANFRKGSVAPKMGKEDNDLLAMVDKLMRGELQNLISCHVICPYKLRVQIKN
jgi:hypothetical protein